MLISLHIFEPKYITYYLSKTILAETKNNFFASQIKLPIPSMSLFIIVLHIVGPKQIMAL